MKWMSVSGRILTVIWAAFWIFFFIGSAISGWSEYGVTLSGVLGPIFILVMLLGCIYLAWRRELVAGILLTLIGLRILIGYPLKFGHRFAPSTVLSGMGLLGLPPLGAGILFLISWSSKRKFA
ncbi:MAG: DUF7670 domain-containing protein [Candidatus Aminicenantales bacterium]